MNAIYTVLCILFFIAGFLVCAKEIKKPIESAQPITPQITVVTVDGVSDTTYTYYPPNYKK